MVMHIAVPCADHSNKTLSKRSSHDMIFGNDRFDSDKKVHMMPEFHSDTVWLLQHCQASNTCRLIHNGGTRTRQTPLPIHPLRILEKAIPTLLPDGDDTRQVRIVRHRLALILAFHVSLAIVPVKAQLYACLERIDGRVCQLRHVARPFRVRLTRRPVREAVLNKLDSVLWRAP